MFLLQEHIFLIQFTAFVFICVVYFKVFSVIAKNLYLFKKRKRKENACADPSSRGQQPTTRVLCCRYGKENKHSDSSVNGTL